MAARSVELWHNGRHATIVIAIFAMRFASREHDVLCAASMPGVVTDVAFDPRGKKLTTVSI